MDKYDAYKALLGSIDNCLEKQIGQIVAPSIQAKIGAALVEHLQKDTNILTYLTALAAEGEEWTEEDSTLAAEEGWGLLNHTTCPEIQRIDDPEEGEPVFASDTDALTHVESWTGHDHCYKALKIFRDAHTHIDELFDQLNVSDSHRVLVLERLDGYSLVTPSVLNPALQEITGWELDPVNCMNYRLGKK